jgi:hypothetical protein
MVNIKLHSSLAETIHKYEIWDFHGGNDNDDVLLGLGAMWTGW